LYSYHNLIPSSSFKPFSFQVSYTLLVYKIRPFYGRFLKIMQKKESSTGSHTNFIS
jgi:hypothetical protein